MRVASEPAEAPGAKPTLPRTQRLSERLQDRRGTDLAFVFARAWVRLSGNASLFPSCGCHEDDEVDFNDRKRPVTCGCPISGTGGEARERPQRVACARGSNQGVMIIENGLRQSLRGSSRTPNTRSRCCGRAIRTWVPKSRSQIEKTAP